MNDIVNSLTTARLLIEDPNRWHQGKLANSNHLFESDALDPKATAWCAIGAVCKSVGVKTAAAHSAVMRRCIELLEEAVAVDSAFGNWNDTHTHAEVLGAFDSAIALAREQYA